MNNKEKEQKIRLGLFVLVGTILFILAMYFIGSKKHLFSNTFTISAVFNNVGGLQAGNNVRFSGIDVGTVQSIDILNDTSIKVGMIVKESVRKFIKKDAIASIGTDGLMGNKLVNISPGNFETPEIQEGNLLPVLNSMDADEMMRRLESTNENVAVITTNLVSIVERVNKGEGVLGKLIVDTVLSKDLEQTLQSVKVLSQKTAAVSEVIERKVNQLNLAEGTIGTLLTDTVLAKNIQQAVSDLAATSEHLEKASRDIGNISKKLDEGDGLAGSLLNDSALTKDLYKSIENIEKGTGAFNENMEALKHNILFRGYFRKLEKGKIKEQ